MMHPHNKPSIMGINLLLLGDDNLGYLPEDFGEYVQSGRLAADQLLLGLISKASISKDI